MVFFDFVLLIKVLPRTVTPIHEEETDGLPKANMHEVPDDLALIERTRGGI
jgi:hypothetical protein